MPLNSAMGDIAHVIQLAIAPVFLLTAVGTLLNVLAAELVFNERRTRLIYLSISLAVMCALLICLLIAIAFLDALITADLSQLVAILFVLSMVALIGSLSIFLREIFLGVNTARVAIR